MISSIIIGISLEGAAAIVALKWAILKSDVTFFSVFIGEALVRLAALGVFTGWLWSRHLPFTLPAIETSRNLFFRLSSVSMEMI